MTTPEPGNKDYKPKNTQELIAKVSQFRFMLLSGSGTVRKSVAFPTWLRVTLSLSGGALLLLAAVAGWYLHGIYGVRGYSMATTREIMDAAGQWVEYEDLGEGSMAPAEYSAMRAKSLYRAAKLGLGRTPVARKILMGHIEHEWEEIVPEENPGTLMWPVKRGFFVRGYGAGSGGYHLAVDVQAPTGHPIHAAAPGVVAYVGEGLRGYGKIVQLVHDGGWATMYAHASLIHVVSGQFVDAGDIIADVGSTGISRGPHLHFEYKFRGKNCDPLPLFRPAVLSRWELDDFEQSRWDHPLDRPDNVDCDRRKLHPNTRYGKQPLGETGPRGHS